MLAFIGIETTVYHCFYEILEDQFVEKKVEGRRFAELIVVYTVHCTKIWVLDQFWVHIFESLHPICSVGKIFIVLFNLIQFNSFFIHNFLKHLQSVF